MIITVTSCVPFWFKTHSRLWISHSARSRLCGPPTTRASSNSAAAKWGYVMGGLTCIILMHTSYYYYRWQSLFNVAALLSCCGTLILNERKIEAQHGTSTAAQESSTAFQHRSWDDQCLTKSFGRSVRGNKRMFGPSTQWEGNRWAQTPAEAVARRQSAPL